MGIQDVIRFLLPREEHFYEYLEKQAETTQRAAALLQRFGRDEATALETSALVQDAEHEGDRLVHEMEEALARTFVTPIDREDLHRLSSELDDVLDRMNGAIRACVILGVERPTPPMKSLIGLIERCTQTIAAIVPKLRAHEYAPIVERARELRAIEKEADTVYREGIRELFREPSPGTSASSDARVLIREKTVLEDLENAIDACDDIADTLTNLAIKHG